MDGTPETLNVEMTPAALARMNEATRARERQRIATVLDMKADAVAARGDAESAIEWAEMAERVRQMATGAIPPEVSSGDYGSRVANDGSPIIPPVALAEVEYADELPQVVLRSDEDDIAEMAAHADQRRRLVQGGT